MMVDGKQWALSISRNQHFWNMCMGADGSFRHAGDFGVDASCEQMFIELNGTQMHIFHEPKSSSAYAKAVLDAVSSEGKIRRLKNNYKMRTKKLVEALRECRKDFNARAWREFQEEFTRYSGGLLITAILGRAGSDKLFGLLEKKGFSEKECHRIIAIVTYPKEHTPLFKSQLDLIKIGARIQAEKLGSQQIDKLLKAWLGKHGYIPVNFCDEPWSIDDARAQLQAALKNDCAKEIIELQDGHKKRALEAKRELARIKDRQITILAHALAEGTYLNEFRKNVFSKINLATRPFLKKIALKCGSKNYRDAFFLTPQETNEVMEGKKIDLKKIVVERELTGMKRLSDGSMGFIDRPTLEKLHQIVLENAGKTKTVDLTAVTLVKGMTANRGKITATARIVLSSKDFHKVRAGDIIVAMMTSVDFVPVMKIAGGFVTNEGGITCHAAIVSREMNKPCVIGTKNATSVIKDGQKIELDANNGAVRIIS